MEKIKKSSVLKITSYILIPFLFLEIIIGIMYFEYQSYNSVNLEKGDYYKTETFLYDEYYTFLTHIFSDCMSINRNDDISNESINSNESYIEDSYDIETRYGTYTLIQETPTKIYYIYRYIISKDCFNFAIVDTKTNDIYTNIKSNDYKKEIETLKNKEYSWTLEEGKIQTELEELGEMQLKYRYGLENLEEIENSNYNIYINFDSSKVAQSSGVYIEKTIYDIAINIGEDQIVIFSFSIFLLLIIAIYLIWSIGYSQKSDEITLNRFDKSSYEVIFFISMMIIAACLMIVSNISYVIGSIYECIMIFIAYIIGYTACAVLGVTTIKRIKSRTLIKSTLIYKTCKWGYNKTKNIINSFMWNKEVTTKLTLYYIGFLLITTIIMIITLGTEGMGIILLLVFWIWTLYRLLKYARQLNSIKETLKDIYEGKENIKIDKENLENNLKEIAEYINSISNGLTKAVEESLKSERMKTELITNVSHDIKTPLTSIINYVDLLKKEEMPNQKAKEYLDILDKKSQRLKRLTEDLVEASKASSGNIKLNMEKINVKELINQISGEYEDKFNEKKLELILNMPDENINIKADSRYLYRVIENMYTNIIKYALEGSRVYIDIIANKSNVEIRLKNISREKLNITADELIQRFVRGETSRNTEGSGLGLSIAQSLTELQKGKFNIYLDGDLFKVTIEFERI